MTKRAVILGLLAAAVLANITFFNDMVTKSTYLIGNFLPLAVFGGLIFFVLLVNPLLARLSRRAALSEALQATER